jgi:hypothetical protein
MELEFDKEIDAILRKEARKTAAAGGLTTAHLEADEIAAFAENALPASTRSYYTKHLADCDRCRTVLAQTVSLLPEAEIESASSAVTTGTVSDIQMPWYRKLFAIPNMAASMGTLVLVFAGLLGYLIYQRNLGLQNPDVAQLNKSDIASNKSTVSEPALGEGANAANASNTSANTMSPAATSGSSPMTKTLGQEEPGQPALEENKPSDAENNERLRAAEVPLPPASAPSTPFAKEQEPPKKADLDDKKLAEKKRESTESKSSVTIDGVSSDQVTIAKDAPIQNNQAQNNAIGGALKSKSGPYRDQQQRNTLPMNGRRVDEDSSAARQVAGKSFEKKDGVWYDSTYHGQTTTNIRRASNEYRSLDAGLRSIADSMRGTVVVVWKDKAYRIQ